MKDLITEARETGKAFSTLAVKKWEKALDAGTEFKGWQENPNTRHKREVVAVLLENQLNSLAGARSKGLLAESRPASEARILEEAGTMTSDITTFTTQMLATVRKTFAPSFVFDLFGVQPLTGPSSYIFYEKWFYDVNKGQTTQNTQIMRNLGGTGFTLDAFFTSDLVKDETVSDGLSTDLSAGSVKTKTAAYTPVKANTLVVKLLKVSDGSTTGTVSFDAAGAATAVTGTGISATLGDHSFNTSSSLITVKVNGNFVTLGAHNLRATYRYTIESTLVQPKIKITMAKQFVEVQNRLVRFEWTRFAESDGKAQYGIDLQARYQDIASTQIRAELERELLAFAFDNAYTTINHDYSSAFTVGNFDDRNKALYAKVKDGQNLVYRLTLRGPANFMVCSTTIASKLDYFMKVGSQQVQAPGPGLQFYGVLDNGLRVYVDPLNIPAGTTHRCLLGFKGPNPENAGIFFAPYEMMNLVDRTVDPQTLNYIQAAYSRYAIDKIEDGQHFYVVLDVDNVA